MTNENDSHYLRNLAALPQHLRTDPVRLARLQGEANSIRGLYGVPVYLCGSALREDNPEPRDWDLRICLSDYDFSLRYGDPGQWMTEGCTGEWTDVRWRWSDDCVKQTKRAARRTGLNVDFQIYPESHWNALYADSPRVKLDTR